MRAEIGESNQEKTFKEKSSFMSLLLGGLGQPEVQVRHREVYRERDNAEAQERAEAA